MSKPKPLRSIEEAELFAILDKLGTGLRRAIARAASADLRALLQRIPDDVLEMSLRLGSTLPIEETRVWLEMGQGLGAVFAAKAPRSAVRSAKETAERTGLALREETLERVAERAASWAEARAAQLVVQVQASTRKALRRLISSAYEGNVDVNDLSRRIYGQRLFGLDGPRQARLARYAEALEAEGVSPRRLRDLLRRRHERLLRERARTIARTETSMAQAAGQTALWREAATSGDLDTERYELEWVTRVIKSCPICEALDGARASIKGGAFVSRPIERGKRAGEVVSYQAPPVHPRCYCARRVARKKR